MSKLNERTGVGMFILCIVLYTSIVYGGVLRVPGKALSLQEMENILGGSEICNTECKPAGTVCGFGSVGDACFGENQLGCNDVPGSGRNCTYNPLVVLWKCSVTFTARNTCQSKTGSACDPYSGGSIDCGNAYLCLLASCECVDYTTCELDGVSACVGIPYVTQCGQYGTCELE